MPDEPDLFFAPLGAEQTMEAAMQSQQFDQLIADARALIETPDSHTDDMPALYDAQLRALIDAVPLE